MLMEMRLRKFDESGKLIKGGSYYAVECISLHIPQQGNARLIRRDGLEEIFLKGEIFGKGGFLFGENQIIEEIKVGGASKYVNFGIAGC